VNQASATLHGAGGRRIFWQSWLPERPPRAAIVIVHGAGEHSGRYRDVAQRLVDEGFAVYALDHRGHGRSDGPRAVIDRMDAAVADVDRLVDLAAEAYAGVPIMMLGHSMGGTIALEYAIAHQERLAGLVLSGALASVDAAPAPMRALGRLLGAIAPRLPLIAVDSSLVSRDPAVVDAYRADPLVHHGKLPARTVAELVASGETFPERVTTITIPTLILYGTADRLCPPAGSVMLGERIGASDKTVIAYDGLYHEILNEPERDRVLDDLTAWLDARIDAGSEAIGPPPSSSTA
jgi:acylglycerol lipase